MSNTGQHQQTGAKTFEREGKAGQLLPIGFLAFGAATMGTAVLTAITPAPAAFVGKLAGMLDQVGLDKGPLLMFGVLSTAMGFALSKLGKSGHGSSAALSAANFAQSNASSIELQKEILVSVQGELSVIRGEIARARQEAQAAKEEASADGNGEGNDPLFRLAASLDQLGAQIDKRIDKARRETVEAVSSVARTMEVNATQHDEAFQKSVVEVDSVRMDIADLRAQLTRVATDVSLAKSSIAGLQAPSAAPTETSQPEVSQPGGQPEGQPAEQAAPKAAALPIELTDAVDEEAQVESDKAAPAGPIPASKSESSESEEPQFEGFQFETENEEVPEPEAPKLGVNMQSLGFQEPPAPMPKPSEDLGLIDQMQEDTANKGDEAPPLFPDAFDQN